MREQVFVKEYSAPAWNDKEILRYAGGGSGEISALLSECKKASEGVLSYRVCYRVYTAKEFTALHGQGSKGLESRMRGCEYAVAFAATVGLGIDRLIARYSGADPLKALLFQAIGAERAESLCDVFCTEIGGQAAEQGWKTGSRFSPGYGDFPLQAQKGLCQDLDCARRIGVTLNDNLLMTPTKSVTAVVGIYR